MTSNLFVEQPTTWNSSVLSKLAMPWAAETGLPTLMKFSNLSSLPLPTKQVRHQDSKFTMTPAAETQLLTLKLVQLTTVNKTGSPAVTCAAYHYVQRSSPAVTCAAYHSAQNRLTSSNLCSLSLCKKKKAHQQ